MVDPPCKALAVEARQRRRDSSDSKGAGRDRPQRTRAAGIDHRAAQSLWAAKLRLSQRSPKAARALLALDPQGCRKDGGALPA